MKVLFIALCVAVASATTQWYSAYDLTNDQIADLVDRGCYRGAYGGVSEFTDRALSLFTCPLESQQQPFTELPDDAFMCVVELASPSNMQAAEDVLIKNQKTTTLLFQGKQELIIISSDVKIQHEKPELCCPIHWGGLVENTLYVTREAYAPQSNAHLEHPAYLRSLNETLNPDPYILSLMNQFSQARVTDQVKTLSTGPDGTNTRITRNSFAIQVGRAGCLAGWNCANTMAQYVQTELNSMFANYPGQWRVYTNTFRADMCNNVILDLTGTRLPNRWVLTGAHLDSRNTGSGATATGIAPGADDNSSGSAVHLELARIIAANAVQFEVSVRLMWFCGEEQGLLGSAALATSYRQQNLDVIGMFNMDMIGYTDPPNGVVLSFMTGSATRSLSETCQRFSQTYIPSMRVGFTSACCSDQQSFFSRGFPAAGIFETPTPGVRYPRYHQTGDQWDNGFINYEQIWRFGQAISVCAMEFAVPVRPANFQ